MLFSGSFPEKGDDKVIVTLSAQSAAALTNVENIQRWRVDPTMTRGSKNSNDSKAFSFSFSAKRKYAKSKATKPKMKTTQKKKGKKNSEKEKKEKTENKKTIHVLSVDDLRPRDIGRTEQGRNTVRALVVSILDADKAKFPKSPIFDGDGVCRMKFEGAANFTWPQIREGSPGAIECLSFGKQAMAMDGNGMFV